MHNEVMAQRDELKHFHEQVEYDYAIAESIFSNLMAEMSNQVQNIHGINYLSTPSTVFNGDLIVVANRPHGGVYVMIADATGHGLPAAISAIPATRAFFSMAAKGLSLGEIAAEINDVLVRFLPMGMMLAASLFEVRANGFEVSWWGGGLPDGYLIDKDGTIVRRLISTHMPLGVLKRHEFESDLVHFKMEPEQQIFCYTDGVIEATNREGEQFGQERLEQAIEGKRVILPNLFETVRKFAHKSVGDDLSVIAMTFPISTSNPEVILQSDAPKNLVPIDSKLKFTGEILRQVNVMTEVRRFLNGIIQGGGHLDLICSVLSELFANAIEHGLLKLNSAIKEEPDGFFLFYQLREEKIRQLDDSAWIELIINYNPTLNRVTLELEHNGDGFDYQALHGEGNSTKTHGRGIVLASELCDSLEYFKQGCKVKAIYSIGASHHFPNSA
jgi:hypothetical protein